MSTPALQLPNRDSVTTIRDDGSRRFLFPADAHGRYATARRWTAYALIVFYLALPWIRIGGYPAVFLDVAARRFHLFGLTLAAQDLWLLFFLISGVGFSLFFVTALLGRVWCGWACPQTVFLDHVYRRIERWVDGDAVARRALAAAPLSAAKIFRRVVKHALYLGVSAFFTHLFLAYFVSLPEVWAMVSAAPGEHASLFVFMAAYTGLTYFIFAWFREQLCIVICPYGRIQSALTDDHTLVIGYDAKRGEPRSHRKRETGDGRPETFASARGLAAVAPNPSPVSSLPSPSKGDCVDCARCVQVCPTGIDIRQGLQIECIGCAACIDACDDVMTRLHRPRGLIRYDSLEGLSGRRTRWLRPRTLLYGVLLFAGASVATWAVSTFKPASFLVTRITGAPYFVDAASVRNQFFVRLVNKRAEPARFLLQLEHAPVGLQRTGFEKEIEVAALGEIVQPLVLQQPRASYTGPFEFTVRVESADHAFHLDRKIEFLGPEAKLLREEEEEKREHK
ncbi:MAG TPA: cytochrome c oxidase accessory protein CcoG [Opitutaceae bacterium]|nr:cytochrome c oxidase accessory protein CcoG [Opitutaceae bacterium]